MELDPPISTPSTPAAQHPVLASLDDFLNDLGVPVIPVLLLKRREIGRGAWGSVSLGIAFAEGTETAAKPEKLPYDYVALKLLHMDEDNGQAEFRRRLKREVSLWRQLPNHTNVLQLLGVSSHPTYDSICIVMPFISGGTLDKYVKKNPGADRREIIRQIAQGLQHMHDNGFVHGDLKAANVLMGDGEVPKLCDLGLASAIEPLRISKTLAMGSLRWMSPERYLPQNFNLTPESARTRASDVFSFGMTIYEVMSHDPPFLNEDETVIRYNLLHNIRPAHPGPGAVSRGLSDLLWDFVQGCWIENPAERAELTDLYHLLANDSRGVKAKKPRPKEDGPSPIPTTILYGMANASKNFIRLVQSLGLPLVEVIRDKSREDVSENAFENVAYIWKGTIQGQDDTMQVVAVKEILSKSSDKGARERGETGYASVATQVARTRQLQHTQILPLLGVYPHWETSEFGLVFDWATFGDVANYIKHFPNADHVKIIREIGQGLDYLHSNDIVHTNLSTRNVYVTAAGVAVLRSFSFEGCVAETMGNAALTAPKERTLIQMKPPEFIRPKMFGLPPRVQLKESDLYSFGMTIYEILAHQVPFPEYIYQVYDLMTAVLDGETPAHPGDEATERGLSDGLWTFLKGCWTTDYLKRPGLQEFFSLYMDTPQ